MSWAEIDDFLQQTSLTPVQLSALKNPAARVQLAQGQIRRIRVSPAMRIGLSSESRRAIYGLLANFDSNYTSAFPLPLPSTTLIEKADLNPGLREVLTRISFERDDGFYLTDFDVLSAFTRDTAEDLRLSKLLLGVSTLQVEITADSLRNRTEAIRYWSKPRGKSASSVLQMLQASPDIEAIDLTHLLPWIPQTVLNQFPDGDFIPWDANCFWASLNFFADNASPEFLPSYTESDESTYRAAEALHRDYESVLPPFQFGDVLCLVPANTPAHRLTLLHMMVQIAGSVVFTKNGFSRTRPFVLMNLADVKTYYTWSSAVEVRGFRLKPPAAVPPTNLP